MESRTIAKPRPRHTPSRSHHLTTTPAKKGAPLVPDRRDWAQRHLYPLRGIPHGPQAPNGGAQRRLASGTRERERERERRVSDADASYNGPVRSTSTLKHAIPQRKHANNNPLSIATRSLSQGPRQNSWCRPQRSTQTRPLFPPAPHHETQEIANLYRTGNRLSSGQRKNSPIPESIKPGKGSRRPSSTWCTASRGVRGPHSRPQATCNQLMPSFLRICLIDSCVTVW